MKIKMKFITCLILSIMLFGCSGNNEMDPFNNNSCVTCLDEIKTHPIDFKKHDFENKSCDNTEILYNSLYKCACQINAETYHMCEDFCNNINTNTEVSINENCYKQVFVGSCLNEYSTCVLNE